VTVAATEGADYVELSVSDTGIGMTPEQLAHVFDRKLIHDESTVTGSQPQRASSATAQESHGFGLMNCKGIIEKYRKMSRLFAVCTLQAESRQGEGSRFFFRLPKGRSVVGAVLFCIAAIVPQQLLAQPLTVADSAAVYADSAYFSNINGTYERTLLFADSCRQCLNKVYRQQRPKGTDFLRPLDTPSATPPEVLWLHDSVRVNYNVLLDIRNESAVAALALHEWQLYQYNNRIYTQLFKELSADANLEDYCRTMQQTRTDRTIALILLIMVLVAIIPAYYFLYLRHRLQRRFSAELELQQQIETVEDDIRCADLEEARLHVSNAVLDNCLSALKHETMYYPSRIRQLVDQGDLASLPEVVAYYRELYGLLSQQAMEQVEHSQLHLTHLEHDILGDETLVRYLYELLQRISGQRPLAAVFQRIDENYVEVSVTSSLTADEHLIDRLLCRQIARDHGEAAHRRRCSVREEHDNGQIRMVIILPAYGKL
jgi:hypothetical protein